MTEYGFRKMIRWARASWVANNVLQKIHGTFGDTWFAPILSATSVRVFDVPNEEALDPRHSTHHATRTLRDETAQRR
jgi:hypothetical protein